ncbi:hypothetical protein HGRIS_009596 [Hohenbuehelia grisea]|uniref:Uncharacterized protein n=1 Tax=Hohenbuehelia grisea TaxID=104357 RepID=A0ABR3J223_9AGAR
MSELQLPSLERNDSQSQGNLKELVSTALQSNKQHQNALTVYTERLADELAKVDKWLTLADVEEDDEQDLETLGTVVVTGAKRAVGLIPSQQLLHSESPFYEEASKRERYLSLTTMHPMKQRELDALQEGVKAENYRKHAFESQRRGERIYDLPPQDILYNTDGLDWDRIAEKVTDTSNVHRTPKECQVRWLGDRHPLINHEPWKTEEIETLKKIVSEMSEDRINWTEVAQKLGTQRTPLDCMRNAMSRVTHTWDKDSDAQLLKYVQIYGKDNWNIVAMHISENVTAQQCQSRYFRSLDSRLTRGSWSEEEDRRLRLAVEAYGNSWTEVALSMHGRTNEQCRERWSVIANPDKRSEWTAEEDELLIEAYSTIGPRWKAISEKVSGRTDRQCRVRYSQLGKQQPPVPEASPVAESAPQADGVSQPAVAASTPGPSVPDSATLSNPAEGNSEAASNGQNDAAEPASTAPRPKPRPKKKAMPNATTAEPEKDTQAEAGPSSAAVPTPVPKAKPRPRPRPRAKTTQAEAAPSTVDPTPDQSSRNDGATDGDEPPSAACSVDETGDDTIQTRGPRPAPRARAQTRKTQTKKPNTAAQASPEPEIDDEAGEDQPTPTSNAIEAASPAPKTRGWRRAAQADANNRPSKRRKTGTEKTGPSPVDGGLDESQAPDEPAAEPGVTGNEDEGSTAPRRSQRSRRGQPPSPVKRVPRKATQPAPEEGPQAEVDTQNPVVSPRPEPPNSDDGDNGVQATTTTSAAKTKSKKTHPTEAPPPTRRQPRRRCVAPK